MTARHRGELLLEDLRLRPGDGRKGISEKSAILFSLFWVRAQYLCFRMSEEFEVEVLIS